MEAQRVVEQACRERGATLIRASDCGDSADARRARRRSPSRGGISSTTHRWRRASSASIDRLGFPVGADAIRTALSDVQWPGRLERFSVGGTEFLLDAAHNPDGARALADYLGSSEWRDATLVFAAMQDKAVEAMLRAAGGGLRDGDLHGAAAATRNAGGGARRHRARACRTRAGR